MLTKYTPCLDMVILTLEALLVSGEPLPICGPACVERVVGSDAVILAAAHLGLLTTGYVRAAARERSS